MHEQVLDFLVRMRQRYAPATQRVLECGSFDVNGTPRPIFADAGEYIGLDWRPGPGVDAVGLVHDWRDKPDGHFDIVLSTEMLEHDPHWQASVRRMVELLRPGGSLLLTCAGPQRPAHEVDCAPCRHYEGLSARQVRDWLMLLADWDRLHTEEHTMPNDTYVAAVGKRVKWPWRNTVSVIIPAVGNVELTRACIASVRATARMRSQIVLVENGSRPANRDALADLDSDVFLSHDRILGYPAAVNLGIGAATGEYVCLLNNDTELRTPGWDARLCGVLARNDAAIVAPVTNFIANPPQRADRAMDKPPFEAPLLFFVCVLMRRNLFWRYGLLDESFGLGNGEDKEFCWRLSREGEKFFIDPQTFVYHAGHGTFGRLQPGAFAQLLAQNEAHLQRMMEGKQ